MAVDVAAETKAAAAWTRAAQRALAADLPHHLRQRGSAILVPSKSAAGVVYHVTLLGGRVGPCDCAAAVHDRPCAHRAAVALRLYERQLGVRVAAVKTVQPEVMRRYVVA
jgi:hypothetical protein